MRGWLMACLMVPAVASAGSQKRFEVVEKGSSWAFDVAWKDTSGSVQQLKFRLPRDDLDEDRSEATWFPRRQYNEHVAKGVRQWGKTLKRVEITAKVQGGGVVVGASGPRDKAKAAMEKAEGVRDATADGWLGDNDFFRLEGGQLSFDHAKLVSEYADDLQPVAKALQKGVADERAYVERALSFVQSIPYEAQKRNGKDPGYRRPLALLYRNRGDCDSKAVLFLGLVEAAYPDVPLSVIYVPGHALTGVGLPEQAEDQTFEMDGVVYLYAEPVGPALNPLGAPADENRKAGKKGEVRPVR